MFLSPNSSRSQSHRQSGLARFASRIGTAMLLGASASLLVTGNAQAVETIQIRYDGTDPNIPDQVTLSIGEIRNFVQSGELPQSVREFFSTNRQDPAPFRQVLTEQIQVPSNLRGDFVESSVGRFVISQLEEFVQGSDVAPSLQAALRQSIQDDRRISLLELIENYPTSTVTLNITGLVQTYNDVSQFVGRVLPALEVAREFLQDIVCDCPQPAASGTQGSSTQSNLTSSVQSATNCVPQSATAQPVTAQPVTAQPATSIPAETSTLSQTATQLQTTQLP